MKKITLPEEEKISALFLCADIFDYPTNKALDDFNSMISRDLGCEFRDYDEIEAEYIRIFNIQSSILKCIPYASWWIDGKMSGATLSKIDDFYRSCGYQFDAQNMKKPADHIGFMMRFVAILAEEKRYTELNEFLEFLGWLGGFVDSLKYATDLEIFPLAGEISLEIINSLKEQVCTEV
ncbi:MAG: molecular chaperone TorD family protein [Sulfurospirillaceae bacterium]|nr:molecular chaperone TorD family protein [Sulfurospirillaceae bacterium]